MFLGPDLIRGDGIVSYRMLLNNADVNGQALSPLLFNIIICSNGGLNNLVRRRRTGPGVWYDNALFLIIGNSN